VRRLARVVLLVLLATSYVTLAVAEPKTATILPVWLPYAALSAWCAVCNLRNGHGRA
jgi:hypothetical protein